MCHRIQQIRLCESLCPGLRALGEPPQPVCTELKPRCYDWKADRAPVGGGVGSGPQPPEGALYPWRRGFSPARAN